jgi:hypothetical protein
MHANVGYPKYIAIMGETHLRHQSKRRILSLFFLLWFLAHDHRYMMQNEEVIRAEVAECGVVKSKKYFPARYLQ